MRYFKTQFQICLKHFLYAQPNYSNGANTHYLKVKPVNHYFKLLIDESFKDRRSSIYTEIAENRREPFDHAIKYLISSNKLLDVDGIDIYYTYLPSVSISAFSCELFLKAWIAEDKVEHIYSPYHQVTHVRYMGSFATTFLKSLPKGNLHNLKEIFLALPEDIQDFHIYIYDCFYKTSLNLSLVDALEKVKSYFIDSRYFFEKPNAQYDAYLVNDLANFFYEVFLFLNNWNGKVHTDIN